MPVAQLIIESLVFALFKHFTQTQPATADRLWHIPNTAFFRQLGSHIFVAVGLLLQFNDAGVVGIVVSIDALGNGSNSAQNSKLAARLFLVDCFDVGGWRFLLGGLIVRQL